MYEVTEPCTENDVRLNDGLVQVCHDEQWGLVCRSYYTWNLNAVKVVCKQVGSPSKSQLVNINNIILFYIFRSLLDQVFTSY